MRVTPGFDTLNSLVICDEDRVQYYPATVYNGTNHMVVWSDERFVDDNWYVVAARVTPQGAVLDTGTCIGNGGTQREYCPDIEYDGDRCLAVWYHYNTPYGVYGRFINDAGQAQGSVFNIASTDLYYYVNPRLAFDGINYLVVWVDRPGTYYNIYGQIVSPSGILLGSQISIALDDQTQYYPEIIWDGNFYVVIWREGNYFIKGQRIDANGQLIGSAFQISATSANNRLYPAIAASNTNYLVAWSEYAGSLYNIWGNIDQVIGIEDLKAKSITEHKNATIIAGPLELPDDRTYRIYDISGREVDQKQMGQGVYFIEVDGIIEQKVIKVR